MDRDYDIFVKKIRKMLRYIEKEYNSIMKNYTEEKIIKKSYSLRPTKRANKEQKKIINNYLNQFFKPSLKIIAPLIDKGIIEWAETDDGVILTELLENKKQIGDLIYESCERMYIYKNIKYNLCFNFIIQAYLFIEKEIISFVQQKYRDSSVKTLFSAIKIIEDRLGKQISSSIKRDVDMYRNVINVHKHGEGASFEEVKKNHPTILNNDRLYYNDSTFIFNLELINFDNFHQLLKNFLSELEAMK